MKTFGRIVLGTAALFSTAYGNVGSSIYYALGLVTVYALGMTPVSLGLHSMLTRMPWVLGYFDRRTERSRFAKNLVEQYYYVSGIKGALGEQETRG